MRQLIVTCGVLLAIAACSSSSAGPELSAPGAATGGSTGTSGGSSSGSGGGSSSGGSRTSDFATGGQVQVPTALSGTLAFAASFSGEFYGSLPDGGADLSNLDCRISDGTDLGQLCSPPQPPGSDGGPEGGPTTSRQILDIYVTSISGSALSEGTVEVSLPFDADGGVFATIELTLCSDGGWDFERALSGQVTYQVSSEGMSGQFQALFPGYEDGGGTLDGTFGAAYCGSLNRTP